MALVSSRPSNQPEEEFTDKFTEAVSKWNLEELYVDLAAAKQKQPLVKRKVLTPFERACLRGLLCGYSPAEIAAQLNREPRGLRVDLSRGLYRYIETLTNWQLKDWRNVSDLVERAGYKTQAQMSESTAMEKSFEQSFTKTNQKGTNSVLLDNQQLDWGDAIDTPNVYGRVKELTTLKEWVITDRCRLVVLLGMGGIGKTTLAKKLAEQVQDKFKCIVWRSLRNAPPVAEVLAELIQILTNQRDTGDSGIIPLPETIDGRISRLTKHLREHRCFLVLDNAESVLQSGSYAGRYREGYEGYGQLLRCIGETRHQSCLVLTSQEKPRGLTLKEGKGLPVRSLQLAGLPKVDARKILEEQAHFSGPENDWELLTDHYAGNPLALKMVAPAIQDFFDSNISEYLERLKKGTLIFDDIRDLLGRQFNRLSDLERGIMYWLAINREPLSLLELQQDFVQKVSHSELIEGLGSLSRRSLIENKSARFIQQPVVMEYVTQQFIDQICREVETEEFILLINHALVKAQVRDDIRESQVRFILEPIANRLSARFRSPKDVERKLSQILGKLRFSNLPGYGGGNIINLLCQLKVDLTGYDFSHLCVWQAYLQDVNLRQVNFTHADLAKSIFAETVGSTILVAFSPDSKLLSTGNTDGKVYHWQAAGARLLPTYKELTGLAWAIAFSPDGQILATSGDKRVVKLWNARTGQYLTALQVQSQPILFVAFSPDGHTLASGSEDQTIKLWDVHTGQCHQTLLGHTGAVCSVGFSPNGHTLASGSEDQTIKLWDVHTGQCHQTLLGHTGAVCSVGFSPNGHTLASGSHDETIKLWDIATGECLKMLRAEKPYEGMDITGVVGLTETQGVTLKALGAVEY